MARLQILLDLLLALLLAATLFHALRLERALRILKRDRDALDALLGSFGDSTREAEAGIGRLRGMTELAAGQMARQAEQGQALKDDLAFLIDRGDRLADRIDVLVRTARPLAGETPRAGLGSPADRVASPPPPASDPTRVRSQAERDLLNALKVPR